MWSELYNDDGAGEAEAVAVAVSTRAGSRKAACGETYWVR